MKRLLSIVLFIGASLWAPKTTITTDVPLIDVAPIETINTPAVVSVHDASVDPKRHIAVGVRVYYTFQLLTERSHRIRTGDTRGHHNRYYYY